MKTKSGRNAPKYHDEFGTVEVINMNDERAVMDLENEKKARRMNVNITQTEDRLSEIRKHTKQLGFHNIYDLAQEEIQSTNEEAKWDRQRWRNKGGDLEMLSMLIPDNKTILSEDIRDYICELAGQIFEEEFKQLCQSPDLKLPLKTLSKDKLLRFNMGSLNSTYV